MLRPPPVSTRPYTLLPYTTLFRSRIVFAPPRTLPPSREGNRIQAKAVIPGVRRARNPVGVPVREPCDPESMHPFAQTERWIPDSTVYRAGFLRNPGQTGFRNDKQRLQRLDRKSTRLNSSHYCASRMQ